MRFITIFCAFVIASAICPNFLSHNTDYTNKVIAVIMSVSIAFDIIEFFNKTFNRK